MDTEGSCPVVLPSPEHLPSFSCRHLLQGTCGSVWISVCFYISWSGLGSGSPSICVPWAVCGLDLAVFGGGKLGSWRHSINGSDISLTVVEVPALLHICCKYTRRSCDWFNEKVNKVGIGFWKILWQKRSKRVWKRECWTDNHEGSKNQSLMGNLFLPINKTKEWEYHREEGEVAAPEHCLWEC